MSMNCKYCGTVIMEDDIDYCCQCRKVATRTEPKEQDVCPECGQGSDLGITPSECELCHGTGKAYKENN